MSDSVIKPRAKVETKVERPRLHKVILYNDDYTPREFVVAVLMAEFSMTEGQAHKVMNALWGQGLMSLAKVLVIVDHWVNVRDPQEAWWVALNNIDPERDARFTLGPVDVLDHSSRAFTFGSKMGLDATRKLPEEGFTREWPGVIVMDEATKQRVSAMWSSLGIPAGTL